MEQKEMQFQCIVLSVHCQSTVVEGLYNNFYLNLFTEWIYFISLVSIQKVENLIRLFIYLLLHLGFADICGAYIINFNLEVKLDRCKHQHQQETDKLDEGKHQHQQETIWHSASGLQISHIWPQKDSNTGIRDQ